MLHIIILIVHKRENHHRHFPALALWHYNNEVLCGGGGARVCMSDRQNHVYHHMIVEAKAKHNTNVLSEWNSWFVCQGNNRERVGIMAFWLSYPGVVPSTLWPQQAEQHRFCLSKNNNMFCDPIAPETHKPPSFNCQQHQQQASGAWFGWGGTFITQVDADCRCPYSLINVGPEAWSVWWSSTNKHNKYCIIMYTHTQTRTHQLFITNEWRGMKDGDGTRHIHLIVCFAFFEKIMFTLGGHRFM